MKYRDRYDLMYEVLDALSGGSLGVTRLMYRVQTSYPELRVVLKLLFDNSLIEQTGDQYKMVGKGARLLDLLAATRDMIWTTPLTVTR